MTGRPEHRTNLPTQLTSLVGRRRELAEVAALLGEHRLVTLTGTGGLGKTRLAFEAATAALAGYRDGAWAIEFAALADPAHVAHEAAARLGVQPRPGDPPLAPLQEALAERELLLVLDSCEHVLGACADLAEALLRSCPGLRVLATSRERLGVPGEAVYVVPSLESPDPRDDARPEGLARYGAVHLFVERARLARADFALTDENAAAVAEICQRVDGIPLALELAAARVRALPVEEIATRLATGPFRLLTAPARGHPRGAPARQQTLSATLDWSYDTLAEAERALLRRLPVFVGGFALDAAEAVCAGGDDLLDLLTGLIDKSLVVADRRYRLLEPIRQYAAEKLAETGETEAVRAHHRDWYLALAERGVAGMISPDQIAWFERLDAEHGNLRAALEHSRAEPNPEAELRLVGALAPFWMRTKHHAEGRARLDDVLARTQAVATPAGRRARVQALDWRGFGDQQEGGVHAERAVALAREIGDGALLALALRHLAVRPDRRADAAVLLRQALECARAAGVTREVGYATASLARLSLDRDPTAEDERLASEALEMLRRVGDRDALMYALRAAAEILLRRAARGRARAALEEAAAIARQMPWFPIPHDALMLAWLDRQEGALAAAAARLRGVVTQVRGRADPTFLLHALAGVAGLAAAWGDPRAAARLFGAAMGAEIKLGGTVLHGVAGEAAAVRRALGDDAFAAAWAEGQRMHLDDAAAYALGLEPPPPAPAPGGRSSPLTPREQEVARLIAEGKSNREIAEALVIARPTAERHVANILNKLGVHNRAQVAAWHERQSAGARGM